MAGPVHQVLLILVAVSMLKAATAQEETTTAAPGTEDVSAYTINPEDGSEVVLEMPDYEKCLKRNFGLYRVTVLDSHFSFWVSLVDLDEQVVDSETGKAVNQTYTWIEARNRCRVKCMEPATLNTYEKNRNLRSLLEYLRVDVGVWTSGKRCLADECADIIDPVQLNGWYWSTTDEMLHPADQVEEGWEKSPWSDFGILGSPQPDNAESIADPSVIEACLAMEADPETGKMAWHDVACDRKLGVVCEPAPELVKYVEETLNVTLQG